MARIDLNRFRKIYPQMKRSPRYFNQTNEIKTFALTFSNADVASIQIGQFTSPVVVVSPNENVNVWLSGVTQANGVWTVEVKASAPFMGQVNIHVHEATS